MSRLLHTNDAKFTHDNIKHFFKLSIFFLLKLLIKTILNVTDEKFNIISLHSLVVFTHQVHSIL